MIPCNILEQLTSSPPGVGIPSYPKLPQIITLKNIDMLKKLLSLVLVSAVMLSCKKETLPAKPTDPIEAISFDKIKVPTGFTWENSRNINLSIEIGDVRFPKVIHVVSIYNGDPVVNGKLLTKGSATTEAPFKSKIYLSNQVTEVYIVTMFPNGTKTSQKVKVGTAEVKLVVGL